jgi:dipeptidyl aminopeptidase/acylaminoacyl peptidase
MDLSRHGFWAAAATAILLLFASPSAAPARPLTIDDVLAIVALDRVAMSPDGNWIAAVIQRPVQEGEVYGRASYETDMSRSDVWLISRRTGERRNLTQGTAQAAGYWCPAWSPDGQRLAMLSTKPEGEEPRGGDNVRLYVWNRSSDAVTRLANGPIMTQTRYGSPMYALDVRGADGSVARCGRDEERAPFVWLDERRLLAAMLPPGALSGFFEEYGRPALHTAETVSALRDGRQSTATAVGSGDARLPEAGRRREAVVQVLDVETRAIEVVGNVPIHPFRGDLSLSVSPDRRRLAVMATEGMIPPGEGWRFPHPDGSWAAEKRLGFADISTGTAIAWAEPPATARYPLELLGWSRDSQRVAMRARRSPEERSAALFIASAADRSISSAGPPAMSVGTSSASVDFAHDPSAFWLDAERLIARLQPTAEGGRADWWLIGHPAGPVNLTRAAAEAPEALRRGEDGAFYAVSGGRLQRLDIGRRALVPVPGVVLPEGGGLVWPHDASRPASHIFVAAPPSGGSRVVYAVPLGRTGANGRRFTLPRDAEIVAADLSGSIILSIEANASGTTLRATERGGGEARELLALNRHLTGVDWGANQLIDYRAADGEALKGAVILPPGYRPGERYPTLVWVYGGYRVRDLNGYFLTRQMPGFYNLYLYAARGYVVLIPSMPLRRDEDRNDSYPDLPRGVLPAVERLVELGIADPDRVGVFGQSFGGYSVYGLVTQTQRFRAAVAIAGITDLPALYNQFDPAARGYQGIEHEKSDNWWIVQMGQWGLDARPGEDPERYRRNSPIDYVEQVETPLLLIHGEHDKRGQMSQAEAFFYALYRRGRTARLLRYWGESHSLAQSPANVRDIFEQTASWFDRYLAPRPAAPTAPPTP